MTDIDVVFLGLARDGTIEVARTSIAGPVEEWVSAVYEAANAREIVLAHWVTESAVIIVDAED